MGEDTTTNIDNIQKELHYKNELFYINVLVKISQCFLDIYIFLINIGEDLEKDTKL